VLLSIFNKLLNLYFKLETKNIIWASLGVLLGFPPLHTVIKGFCCFETVPSIIGNGTKYNVVVFPIVLYLELVQKIRFLEGVPITIGTSSNFLGSSSKNTWYWF